MFLLQRHHVSIRRINLKTCAGVQSGRIKTPIEAKNDCFTSNDLEREILLGKGKSQTSVSPLIRFKSAVLRYPPLNYMESYSDIEFDYGLNEDHNEFDRDLILESYSSLTNEECIQQQLHLRRHWNQQQFPSTHNPAHLFDPFDLNIWPNLECGSGGGGHVVLGRNGSGKTLLSRSLVHLLEMSAKEDMGDYYGQSANNDNINPFLRSGTLFIEEQQLRNKCRNQQFLSHVSFESHSQLLLKKNTTTVHRALIPSGGNRLSPTARFLAVRLGMYPLLPRRVNTLSTGEIRRVLLVRALVSKPELLVLDNAFDGLDAHGRKGLQDIIERVLQGFQMDILVLGVGEARDTARTQVLLLTHRPEEISKGIGRVTFIDRKKGGRVKTEMRMGRMGEDLVRSLISWEDTAVDDNECERISSSERNATVEQSAMRPWEIASNEDLPANVDINTFWEHGKLSRLYAKNYQSDSMLVEAKSLKVTRDDTTLLSNLDWTIHRGERWHLSGTNGAGKSTLSRLLVRMSMSINQEWDVTASGIDAVISEGSLAVTPTISPATASGGIGWVSTELHLHAAHNWGKRIVLDILTSGIASYGTQQRRNDVSSKNSAVSVIDTDLAITAARWLGLLHDHNYSTHQPTNHPLLSRPFSTLSQGEQKLLLIASAIAQRPSLRGLDEPCQGLDLWNRGHVLGFVERLCQVTDISLVYVTHHEEELIPSIDRRLCLEDGKVTYCGLM